MRKFTLDRLFFRRFGILLRMMFPKVISAPVFLSIYVLAASILGECVRKRLSDSRVCLVFLSEQVLAYFLGIVPSEFYVVLGHRDLSKFNTAAWKAVCIVFAKVLVSTVSYVLRRVRG